jgi:hypothetical protein
MEQVLEEIRSRVCSRCIDANVNGRCTLPSELRCPLELYTSRITQVIASVSRDDYPAYVDALRKSVCSDCAYGSPDDCALRSRVDCPLDRYYPLVIEVVEEYLDAVEEHQIERT